MSNKHPHHQKEVHYPDSVHAIAEDYLLAQKQLEQTQQKFYDTHEHINKRREFESNLQSDLAKYKIYEKDLKERYKLLQENPSLNQELEVGEKTNKKTFEYYDTLLTPHILELTQMDKLFDEEVRAQFETDFKKNKIDSMENAAETGYTKANDVTTAQITYYAPEKEKKDNDGGEDEDGKKKVKKQDENKFVHTMRISNTSQIKDLYNYCKKYFNAPSDYILMDQNNQNLVKGMAGQSYRSVIALQQNKQCVFSLRDNISKPIEEEQKDKQKEKEAEGKTDFVGNFERFFPGFSGNFFEAERAMDLKDKALQEERGINPDEANKMTDTHYLYQICIICL